MVLKLKWVVEAKSLVLEDLRSMCCSIERPAVCVYSYLVAYIFEFVGVYFFTFFQHFCRLSMFDLRQLFIHIGGIAIELVCKYNCIAYDKHYQYHRCYHI